MTDFVTEHDRLKQAVVDAARDERRHVWAPDGAGGSLGADSLHPAIRNTIAAVDALDAYEKAKPRWSVDPGGFIVGPRVSLYVQNEAYKPPRGLNEVKEIAERICGMLNEADK